MHGGEFKAYAITQGVSLAATNTQGKGREDRNLVGLADPSVTVYREHINTPTNSRLTGFINRAAAALSVVKSDIVIEDIHGRKMRAGSIEGGTNVYASPVENL